MTGINYLDEVFNPISGCSGKGCKVRDNCWARGMVKRFPQIHGDETIIDPMNFIREYDTIPFDQVQFHPDRLDKPLHWKKPRRIGVCFTGDWMDAQVKCEWIDRMLEVIAACPQHQFFTLTKQPQNLGEKIYGHCPERSIRELGGGDYLPNLYNGVSITDQEDADSLIPELLRIPGKHWVSYEPAIGPMDFEWYGKPGAHYGLRNGVWGREGFKGHTGIDWIVIGCESGPRRRPMRLEWAIDVVRQCKAAGVPVYCKQIQDEKGKVIHDITKFPTELRVRQWPK
jgi:protein gp37